MKRKELFELAIKMSRPLEEIGLSTHTVGCLRRWRCDTVGDVYQSYLSGNIKKVRGIGKKSMIEIEHYIGDDIAKILAMDESETNNVR